MTPELECDRSRGSELPSEVARAPGGGRTWRIRFTPGIGWLSWLAIGTGGLTVALALRETTRYPAGDWNAGATLLGAVLALAGMFLLGGLAVFGPVRRDRAHAWVGSSSPPGVILGIATIATLIGAVRRWDVDAGSVGWDVFFPWLFGMALFSLAAWWPELEAWRGRKPAGSTVHRLRPGWSWAPWVGLSLLAAVPRLAMLDRFPSFIEGDEGQYLLMAVSAHDGTMRNPFATGWLDVPLMYPAIQGWLARITGDDLVGHRLVGALVGTAGVLATWRLGRWIVGPGAALAGAALMATMPFHLYFSRSAMNHVLDPAALALALLFLWRGKETGRRGDAFLCGMAVALGWYGYWGARAFPAIVAVLIGLSMLDRRVGLRGGWRLGLWSAIGFVATTAPLLMTFLLHPDGFRSRLGTTSIGAGDPQAGTWLDRFPHYRANLREAMLLPAIDNWRLFFRHHAPFLGWPMALLLAVAGAAVLAAIVRHRAWLQAAWLIVPWGVLTLGVAATDPVQSQRVVAVIPIWALLAGCGLTAAVTWLTAIPLLDRAGWRWALTVAVVLAMGWSNLAWMTSDERQLTTWGDLHTLAAWDIGWRLSQDGSRGDNGPIVLFAGAPYMFIDDWGNLSFLAPHASVTDLEEPDLASPALPDVSAGTMLILVGERQEERCALEASLPGLTTYEARDPEGNLLYLAFANGMPQGWSGKTSLAGTTWAVVASPCGP